MRSTERNNFKRGGAARLARQAHNLKVIGSNPISATTFPVPSRDNPGGTNVATRPRSLCDLPAGARISDASRLFRLNDFERLWHNAKLPASGDAYALEVRNGAAGKGPRLKLSAMNAESIRGDRSPEPIQFAGLCQPRPGSRRWGNCGSLTHASGDRSSGCIWHRLRVRENRSAIHSSDSLGHHQPGSTTWGGRIATPAPSGRAARDRAIGLTVARFNSAPAESTLSPELNLIS